MLLKRVGKMILMGTLVLTLSACTTHRKPVQEGANGYGRSAYANGQEGGGSETYSEGAGREGSGSAGSLSSKCRPGRSVAGAEQHYFFDFDSNDVREDGIESIHQQANYLVKHPNIKIRLEGNTDDRGSAEYNVALGERRAHAVLSILQQSGVAANQVTTVSFGAEKPATGGEDESARQCNRRVDLKYVDK